MNNNYDRLTPTLSPIILNIRRRKRYEWQVIRELGFK
jgi:hypothetical protein